MTQNTKEKGDLGELLVTIESMRRGYNVLKPIGDNQRYDLVLEKNGAFQRVQVKHLKPKPNGRICLTLYTVQHNKESTSTKYKRVSYDTKQVDIVAIVNMDTDQVFMVPMKELQGLTSMMFNTKSKDETRCSTSTKFLSDFSAW